MDILEALLKETKYHQQKSKFLVDGFREGFDLGYRGPTDIRINSPNLKFVIGNEQVLWEKVMKEVKDLRYAGPFEEIPFEYYLQSPIGLVPKDGGKKTRLIFHLSYPKNGTLSVNYNTPDYLSTVEYQDFDRAIQMCIDCLKFSNNKLCYFGKSDMSNAFRHLPIKPFFWRFLVMKAKSPLDGRMYYFIDKCLPFGASISCAIFQAFSDAISHIVAYKVNAPNLNYLDNFFFVSWLKEYCNNQLHTFLTTCKQIYFPVALEKTVWATTTIEFLGLGINANKQKIYVPPNKVIRALELIKKMLERKKSTLRELQQLCGYLNFLGKCIVPGRPFTRRLYPTGVECERLPHHHIDFNVERRKDLEIWKQFLNCPDIFNRSFFDLNENYIYAPQDFYTDASRNSLLGCGGYCKTQWFMIQWDKEFIDKKEPSINYLELYALTVGILLWGRTYKNQKITIFCNNQSVIFMVNNLTSKCRNCMTLIRIITLFSVLNNVKIKVKYVKSEENSYADDLSRMRYKQFLQRAKSEKRTFDKYPREPPSAIYPINKLWLDPPPLQAKGRKRKLQTEVTQHR